MADVKPTLQKPVSQLSKGYEKTFNDVINKKHVKLSEATDMLYEIDNGLNEVEQSLKKKIFSLAKMEALVFSDPKLSAKYEEMAENGEEKYGYHYNETIQNMLFNDYVLNSPKYLQKYKQAVPKEKKRRDKSGINQLKKTGVQTMQHKSDIKPTKLAPTGLKPVVKENDEPLTKVQFLVNEKDPGNPDLFAYFPEEDDHGNYKMAYSHVGQHTSASPEYAKESRPATPEEYADLKAELESIGYNLEVLNSMAETTGSGGGAGGMGSAFGGGTGQYTAPLGYKKKVAENEPVNVAEPEEVDMPDKPEQDDCFIESNGYKEIVSCGGKYVGEFIETRDSLDAIKKWKAKNNFNPNTWYVSDHGNLSLIDDDGNILNETTGTGGGSGGSDGTNSSGSGPYYGPAMWGSGDLMKVKGKAKVKKTPAWKGGTIIQESNYLTETNGFEEFIKILNEDDSFNKGLGKEYQSTHTNSNKGMGVSPISQSSDRKAKEKKISDNTMLFVDQDVDLMRDKDVDILHNDMTKKNSFFPHKDNPNLKNDGISGTLKETNKKNSVAKEDNTIVDDTSAFTNNTVKGWDKADKDTEMNTIKTGELESKNLDEKSKSKAQQRFMGMVHAVQKGELSPNKVGGKVAKAADSMSYKDADDFASTKHKNLPEKVDETLSLHDVVEYISDRSGEEPFMLNGIKWQFVNAKYPDGKTDIGVYRFGHDLVYDYSRWREEMGIDKNNVKEETQTMIQSDGMSMSNKAVPTGDQSTNVDMGARSTGGGGSISESANLLEEINNELKAFSIHQDKLKKMTEDRKPSALVLKDRLGVENKKNFKKDLKDSSISKIVDIENALEYNDQQTEVKDPYELGEKLEKGEIKATDAKSGEALKDVGDSANDAGDEIPKRNMTTEEADEVKKYKLNLKDYVYDNEPGKRFEDRMKADMGDENYKQRQINLEFRGKAPMYNKDPQPIEQTKAKKVQFDKEQTGWNERVGLKEGMVSGKYFDALGKKKIVDFDLKEVVEITDVKEAEKLQKLNLEGLGNTYTSKVSVNENVVKAMNEHKFFTDGTKVFAMKNPVQNLNENEQKTEKRPVNEQFGKMKHLLGYKPDVYMNTDNVKKNRGF